VSVSVACIRCRVHTRSRRRKERMECADADEEMALVSILRCKKLMLAWLYIWKSVRELRWMLASIQRVDWDSSPLVEERILCTYRRQPTRLLTSSTRCFLASIVLSTALSLSCLHEFILYEPLGPIIIQCMHSFSLIIPDSPSIVGILQRQTPRWHVREH